MWKCRSLAIKISHSTIGSLQLRNDSECPRYHVHSEPGSSCGGAGTCSLELCWQIFCFVDSRVHSYYLMAVHFISKHTRDAAFTWVIFDIVILIAMDLPIRVITTTPVGEVSSTSRPGRFP